MGWRVFPLKPRAKLPATKNGFKDASTKEEDAIRWWKNERRNIGIVAGSDSGIWVLDCDIDKQTGETIGEAWLARMEEKYGALPLHPIQRTPSGGSHHVFAWPEDGLPLPRRIGAAPCVDVLGEGGYFIGYPSVLEKGVYRWEQLPSKVKPPPAPEWLLDIARRKEETIPVEIKRSDGTNAYGRAALSRICEEIASTPPGRQEVTLVERATRIGSIAAHGDIEQSEAFSALVDAGMRMANAGKPWTRREIETKVKRAMEFGSRDPYVPRPREKPTMGKLQLVVNNQEKPEPIPIEKWEMGLPWLVKSDGFTKRPKEAINCQLMIEHHPVLAGVLDYDEFADQIWITRGLPGDNRSYPRLMSDDTVTEWTAWLNTQGISPGYEMVQRHMHSWAKKNARDPLKDYLNELKWDGKPRIDTWLTYYASAQDTAYTRVVGRKFMLGAAVRALMPGSKVDYMLVLEGIQGIGKSTLGRVLFGDKYFTDQIADVRNKEGSISLQGMWCIEVAEMDKFSRVEANAVKSFLTHTEDRYRPHYGRHVVSRPRRCVFLGTINPDGTGYLRDQTGNRRFLPVTVESIDLDAIAEDRDQLWAEAAFAIKSGEKWWLAAEEELLATSEQEERVDEDVWEQEIRRWIEDQNPTAPTIWLSVNDCLRAIGVQNAHQNSREANRVRQIFKKMKCIRRNNPTGMVGRFWEYRRTK